MKRLTYLYGTLIVLTRSPQPKLPLDGHFERLKLAGESQLPLVARRSKYTDEAIRTQFEGL
jgi:hypothetical protein